MTKRQSETPARHALDCGLCCGLAECDCGFDQMERFNRDGFIVLPGFLPRVDLDRFEKEFAQLRDCGYEPAEQYDICSQITSFLRIISSPEIAAAATSLMPGSGPLYCFTSRCLVAPPNDERRTYGWHQEVFYTIPGSRFVQSWAPLIEPSTVENGTIEVCVGSHKAGVVRQDWIEREGHATQIIVDPVAVDQYEQRTIEMQVGDLLLFDGRLFHRSGKNTSPRTRYSMVGMYHDTAHAGFRGPKPLLEYRGLTPREAWTRQGMA